MSRYNLRAGQHVTRENLRTGNDRILSGSVDNLDTSVVNAPGNLFQVLDTYFPMESDANNSGSLGYIVPSTHNATSNFYPTTPPVQTSPSPLSVGLETPAARPTSVLPYPYGLVLQCRPGHHIARITEQELPKYHKNSEVPAGLHLLRRLDPNLRIYHYYDAPETTVTYECPFPDCNGRFSNTKLMDHFNADHRPFQKGQTLTCKECQKSMQVVSYIEHFKDQHNGHFIYCAYCGQHLLRRNTLTRHFGACGPLKAFLKDCDDGRQYFVVS